VYNTLSNTYMHLLVLISYLIAQCMVMDHLKLRETKYLSSAIVLHKVSVIHAPSLPPTPNCKCAADSQHYSCTISPPIP